MTVLDRAEQFLRRDLWIEEAGAVRGLPRLGLQALRMTIAVAVEFRHLLFDARAAGLVYTTLLSLVPFLAVTFSVLKAFGAHRRVEPLLAEALAPLGEKGVEITSTIIGFVNNLNVGLLGAAGVAALFLTAYSLISKIENAFNAIWRVGHGRVWTRRFTDYLSVVLVGPVAIVTATALMASAQSHWLVQRALEMQPLGWLAVWIARLMPSVLLFACFTFLHMFVPNTTVRPGSAAIGGATTTVLWSLAGTLFASFVAGSARYSAIYSGFAILILLLMWLYVSWLVVLVGAQVAFFHQHPATLQTHMLWRRGSHATRERLGLALLLDVTRRYLRGEGPLSMSRLAATTGAPAPVIAELVEEFVEGGLLCRVAEPAGIALLRPPEQITMSEVLGRIDRGDASAATENSGERDPVDRVLGLRDGAVESALKGITLRSFAEQE